MTQSATQQCTVVVLMAVTRYLAVRLWIKKVEDCYTHLLADFPGDCGALFVTGSSLLLDATELSL